MAINPIELQKHLSGLDLPGVEGRDREEGGGVGRRLRRARLPLKKIEDKEYDAPTAINSAVSDAS
ncbi:DUF2795 domain-containing protein [Clavibacter tessellarius]|uniref:DUF2795 domain-containing protein n=1 Tax=Clavibacter tessellarius TaxID=31965 RepID=UPI003249FE8C